MERLFQVKKMQIEILEDRGYIIPDTDEDIRSMDVDEFSQYINTRPRLNEKDLLRSSLMGIYRMKSDHDKVILVCYEGVTEGMKQVSKDTIKKIIGYINYYKADNVVVNDLMLILESAIISSGAKETINMESGVNWQIFDDSELMYNPIHHIDVPKHTKLTDDEKENTLQQLKINIDRLLIIRKDDPIVKHYGWNAGDVIRTTRKDLTVNTLASRSINYRVVVN